MVAYTLTSSYDFDNAYFSGRAGADTYAISGVTLTINTDTRYCANSTGVKGNIAGVTVSSTLGGKLLIDGRNVRIIPFDGGSNPVPAIGTAITQGDVTGPLLGVYSALNVAPTAAAATMPASGWIKIKSVSGGAGVYAAGALGGLTANATGPDVVGWIEVVAIEAATCTVSRLGSFEMKGAWFDVGTCSGVANQTIQMPASLPLTHYPGVWIETTTNGVYEFYPNAGSTTTAVATDVRGKMCWISSQGLLRIGADLAATTKGFLPANGRKIRVPNIITLNANSTAGYGANVVPSSTLATRYDFTMTGAGAIDIDKANIAWSPNFGQAYSVSITDTGILDSLIIAELGSRTTLTNVGVGVTNAVNTFALSVTSCFAGADITDCVFARYGLGSSGYYAMALTDLSDFVFTRCKITTLANVRGHATSGLWSVTRAMNCTWENCTMIGGRTALFSCITCTLHDTIYADQNNGATTSTIPQNVFDISSMCSGITMDGLTWLGSITNVHPYTGIMVTLGSANIKLRNIGTYSTPLTLGSSNASRYIVTLGGNSSNIEVQRVYCANAATSPVSTLNSDSKVVFTNFFSDYADTFTLATLNCQAKGCGGVNSVTGQTSCYGTHWFDVFTSTTAGRIGFWANEKTTVVPSSTTYTVVAGTPKFTSAGSVMMPTLNDQIIWEMPYYAIGHSSFSDTAPTLTGTNTGNFTINYKIDKNDGNGYGVNWTLMSQANIFAISGIDATLGFKLQIQVITASAAADNAITAIRLATVSSTTTQAYQYPLDPTPATLRITGLQNPTEVRVYKTADDSVVTGAEDVTTGIFTYDYLWTGTDTNVYIVIFSKQYQAIRLTGQVLGSTGLILPIQQNYDRQFKNPT